MVLSCRAREAQTKENAARVRGARRGQQMADGSLHRRSCRSPGRFGLDWVRPMPFPALQSMFDPLLPKGLQWHWKGGYVKELSDKAIDTHIAYAANVPSELSLMHLYPIDGAVHRVAEDATACDATWAMVIAGIDPDPAKVPELKRWGRAYWEAVHPFAAGGGYVNFMMGYEGEGRLKATYGNSFERLVAVKRKYDPANLFQVNQNISP